MLGDLARGAKTDLDAIRTEETKRVKGIARHSTNLAILLRASVRMDGRILGEDDFPGRTPEVRRTNFLYHIKYMPTERQKYINCPFVLVGDILNDGMLRFGSLDELKSLAESRPDIRYVLNNTNLNKWLLLMAKMNPLMPVPLAFDCAKLYQNLSEQYKKRYDKDSDHSLIQDTVIAEFVKEKKKKDRALLKRDKEMLTV